jgi:hypothetical protein
MCGRKLQLLSLKVEKEENIFGKGTDPDCDPRQFAGASTEWDHKSGPGEVLA